MCHIQLRIVKFVVTVVSAIAVSSVTVAQTDEQVIEYRQAVMQSMGANMAAISIIIKSRLMHQENLSQHAQQLKRSSKLMESAFGQPISAGATDALPEIWTTWQDYLSIAKTTTEESERLAEIGAEGDLKTIIKQVKIVAKSCAKCHKKYRKSKEQSYKN